MKGRLNYMNQNNNQLDSLLQITAKRMGTSPEALKTAAQNGEISKMFSILNKNDADNLQKVLGDPEAAKKLLATPQAQMLLKMFGKG